MHWIMIIYLYYIHFPLRDLFNKLLEKIGNIKPTLELRLIYNSDKFSLNKIARFYFFKKYIQYTIFFIHLLSIANDIVFLGNLLYIILFTYLYT